jgi:hypothetical protein
MVLILLLQAYTGYDSESNCFVYYVLYVYIVYYILCMCMYVYYCML